MKCKVFKIKLTLAFLEHCGNEGNEGNEGNQVMKGSTHLWSSSSLEHLGQTQEIHHKLSSAKSASVGCFGQGICFKGQGEGVGEGV